MNKEYHALLSAVLFLFIILFNGMVLHAQPKNSVPPFSFLSTTVIGAHQFIQSHPSYDGRGVIIFILDTGVDMGIPGLQKTPAGEVKVIDVRDFSREGDVALDSVRITAEDNEKILITKEGKLYRPDKLAFQPTDSIYWVGWFDEKRFKNSAVHDINDNGSTNDRFGVVAFPVKEMNDSYWICYIDLDDDGQLDDERPLRDYGIRYDTFQFSSIHSSVNTDKALTFAININREKKLVSFHFDDGSHGTHVAGIAAGYNINGAEGFNGIAPGAKIISLKIGNNTLSGGATVSGSMKQAYDFVMEYSRTHNVPVVVNMSYGIGSEIEGRSKIENYLDKLLMKNENVVVCVAAGNEGPGISSIGNPAGSQRVISTGALLPPETGRDLMASSLTDNVLFFFSSRGGETAKPDVITPGYASSTVPHFMTREKFGGTSMASPQTAGAVALLLSAALQQTPPLKYNSTMVKRALKNSAKELSDATALDQGAGIIQVAEAFDLLQEYTRDDSSKINVHYTIRTDSPVYPDGKGSAAYWRTGGYFPNTNEVQFFNVTAQFSDDVSSIQKENYFKSFILKSNAPWIRINQQETYLKSDQTTGIQALYDRSLLREPGLYVGKVIAYERTTKGFDFSKSATVFELLNTLIVPYYFTPENNYQQNFPYRRISAGIIHRYFCSVPPGATGMYFYLQPSSNSECYVKPFIFTPEGHEAGGYDFASSKEGSSVKGSIVKNELVPGIWE
ncbi:MAG: S8 family serine peptidase, partial [Patescibacteria group bacterium]|nr:S8 family serine peptidase [Patescibacteria group bacterium]